MVTNLIRRHCCKSSPSFEIIFSPQNQKVVSILPKNDRSHHFNRITYSKHYDKCFAFFYFHFKNDLTQFKQNINNNCRTHTNNQRRKQRKTLLGIAFEFRRLAMYPVYNYLTTKANVRSRI